MNDKINMEEQVKCENELFAQGCIDYTEAHLKAKDEVKACVTKSRVEVLAQAGYEGYCENTGWKSAITQAPLPRWDDLDKEHVKNGWRAAARAVVTTFLTMKYNNNFPSQEGL